MNVKIQTLKNQTCQPQRNRHDTIMKLKNLTVQVRVELSFLFPFQRTLFYVCFGEHSQLYPLLIFVKCYCLEMLRIWFGYPAGQENNSPGPIKNIRNLPNPLH